MVLGSRDTPIWRFIPSLGLSTIRLENLPMSIINRDRVWEWKPSQERGSRDGHGLHCLEPLSSTTSMMGGTESRWVEMRADGCDLEQVDGAKSMWAWLRAGGRG